MQLIKIPIVTLALLYLFFSNAFAQVQPPGPPFLVYKNYKEGFSTRYLYGYMDENSKLVIDYQFNSADRFKNGYATVGKMIRSGTYAGAGYYTRSGIIDSTGRVVAPCIYTSIEPWIEGGRWTGRLLHDSLAIIDRTGKVVYCGPGKSVLQHSREVNRMSVTIESHPDTPKVLLMDYDGNLISTYKSRYDSRATFSTVTYHHSGYKTISQKFLYLLRNKVGAVTDMEGNIVIDSVWVKSDDYGGFGNARMVWVGPNQPTPVDTDYIVLQGPDKAAVVDTNFKEIIPFSAGYKSISPLDGTPYFSVKKADLWGIIDIGQNVILEPSFKYPIDKSNASWFHIEDKEKKLNQYYDYKGNKVLECRSTLELAPRYHNYPQIVVSSDTTCRLWNGKFIGERHRSISQFNDEGYAGFEDKDTKGILDTNGTVVYKARYFYLSLPENGFMCAGDTVHCPVCNLSPCAERFESRSLSYTSRYFIIDMHGKRVGKEDYESIYPFHKGYTRVLKNCEEYFLDTKGKRTDAAKNIKKVSTWVAGVCIVTDKDNRHALFSENGKIISDQVDAFNTLQVYTNRYTLTGGGFACASPYQGNAPDFKNRMIAFKLNEKFGLMDSTGKIVAQPEYTRIADRWGYSLLYKREGDNEHVGAINRAGKIIIPVEYELIESQGIPDDTYYMAKKTRDGDGDWTIFHDKSE